MFAVKTWHVAGDDGGPPSPDYRYHTHRDCGNLRRIIDIESERLRKGPAASASNVGTARSVMSEAAGSFAAQRRTSSGVGIALSVALWLLLGVLEIIRTKSKEA